MNDGDGSTPSPQVADNCEKTISERRTGVQKITTYSQCDGLVRSIWNYQSEPVM